MNGIQEVPLGSSLKHLSIGCMAVNTLTDESARGVRAQLFCQWLNVTFSMWRHSFLILAQHKMSCLVPIIYFNGYFAIRGLVLYRVFLSFPFFQTSHINILDVIHIHFLNIKTEEPTSSSPSGNPSEGLFPPCMSVWGDVTGPLRTQKKQNFMLSFARNELFHSTPSAAHCLCSSTYGFTFSSSPSLKRCAPMWRFEVAVNRGDNDARSSPQSRHR